MKHKKQDDPHLKTLKELTDEGYYEHFNFTVDDGQTPERIDKFLMGRLPNVSRNRIQNAIKAGCVLVDDIPIKPNHKVKPGASIVIVLPEPPRNKEVIPEDIPLDIVYEDDQLLVVNKPAGMVVHPGHGHHTGTLVNALAHYFSNLPDNSDEEPRPGLVHRIDKGTSGLLVVAKTEHAMTYLAKQFAAHTIEKTYRALVWGRPETDKGTLTGYMGRSPRDRKIMEVFDEPEKGKKAITHFKILEDLGYVSLLECRLETGRTHQIRAHMRHEGHPIFNDNYYGGDRIVKGPAFSKYRQFIQNCFNILPTPALHAKSLGFYHPTDERKMHFETPLTEGFEEILTKWRQFQEKLVHHTFQEG